MCRPFSRDPPLGLQSGFIPHCKFRILMANETICITPRSRKGKVLTPSNFGCLEGVPTVNITNGCLFHCVYCYARGYRQAPLNGGIELYVNLPELVQEELARKRKIPSWVAVNTSSDCFQPHPDILEVSFRVMEVLLENGVGISVLTKGEIPRNFLRLFAKFPERVLIQIGLVSVNERYWRIYEPHTPEPGLRIRNVQRLKEIGIVPELRMDPVIPFLTDTEAEVSRVLERAAQAGVRKVNLSYLHLRPSVREILMREISPLDRKLIEACFHTQDWRVVGTSTQTKLLPSSLREKGYERIGRIAQTFGMTSRVCRCKNPDMKAGVCGSGKMERAFLEKPSAQLSLFRADGA